MITNKLVITSLFVYIQVPGKSLFTLMKCYLRVTSLMDGNNKGENKRNQQKLSWMRFGNNLYIIMICHMLTVTVSTFLGIIRGAYSILG